MCTAAHATDGTKPLPLAEVRPDARAFPSMDEAVSAAFTASRRPALASGNEYGGLVVKGADGQYRHTEPVTNDDRDHVRYRFKRDEASQPAAMYHTHPCAGGHSHEASRDDLRMAKALGLPTYILDMCKGEAYMADPNATTPKAKRGQRVREADPAFKETK